MWYNTSITKMTGIDYPVFQGPSEEIFLRWSWWRQCRNAGGLGGYGTYTLSPQEIVSLDKRIKAATNKPYNLNLWVSDMDIREGSDPDEQYGKAVKIFQPLF